MSSDTQESTAPTNTPIAPPHAVFRQTYPLDFTLANSEGQPVLQLDPAGSGGSLYLQLENVSVWEMQIQPGSGSASADNYHLALSFHAGVLATDSLTTIQLAGKNHTDWDLSAVSTTGKACTLYLLYTAATARSLEPGQTLALTLSDLKAIGLGGALATQVQLQYRLNYSNNTAPLTGSRLHYLLLVPPSSGERQIPLRIGFVGLNTVLADGATANTLILELCNTSGQALDITPDSQSNATQFTLSVDKALGSNNKDIAVTALSPNWAATANSQGETPDWVLTTGNSSLPANKVAQFQLTNIVATSVTRITPVTLTVHYANLPNYPEGQFTVLIGKVPTAMFNINNAAATIISAVNNSSDSSALVVKNSGSYNAGVFSAGTGTTITAKNASDNNPSLYVENSGSGTAGYFYGDTGNAIYLASASEHPALYAKNSGYGAVASFDGKVGIGTLTPQSPLHVGGDATIDAALTVSGAVTCQGNGTVHGYANVIGNLGVNTANTPGSGFTLIGGALIGDNASQTTTAVPVGDLRIAGSVNIGATGSPSATLDVNGDAYISEDLFVAQSIYCQPYNHGSNSQRSPWRRLDVGSVAFHTGGPGFLAGDFTEPAIIASDQRLKDNIAPLDKVLEKVLRLRPISFEWNETAMERMTAPVEQSMIAEENTPEANQALWDREKQRIRDDHAGPQRGLLAQEVEAIFPEWVRNDGDYKSVDMSELPFVLLAALRELKVEKDERIRGLEARVNEQQALIEGLKQKIERLLGSNIEEKKQ